MYFNYVGGKSESEKYMRLNGVGELEGKKKTTTLSQMHQIK